MSDSQVIMTCEGEEAFIVIAEMKSIWGVYHKLGGELWYETLILFPAKFTSNHLS